MITAFARSQKITRTSPNNAWTRRAEGFIVKTNLALEGTMSPLTFTHRLALLLGLLILFPVGVWAQAPQAYVTNLDGTVSVIDTATNTVTATVQAGDSPNG